jgi:hypothetical protein
MRQQDFQATQHALARPENSLPYPEQGVFFAEAEISLEENVPISVIFTTRLESELLDVQLGEACRLYNAALQERRDAWKQGVRGRQGLNSFDASADRRFCRRRW